MASLDFGGGSENKQKNHKCTSEQEGEWIVFRCDLCPDYERRMHLKTGKMVTKGGFGIFVSSHRHMPMVFTHKYKHCLFG